MIYSHEQFIALKSFNPDFWLNSFYQNERIFIDYLLEKNNFTCKFLSSNRKYFDFKIYRNPSPNCFKQEWFEWDNMLFSWHVFPPEKHIMYDLKVDHELSEKEKLFVYIFPDFVRFNFFIAREYKSERLFDNIICFLKDLDIESTYESIFKPLLEKYNIKLPKDFFTTHPLNEKKKIMLEEYPKLLAEEKKKQSTISNEKCYLV